jgi:DNA-binding Lrp family transcriptional regulator
VSSIAAATAINRETVRRRVRNLVKAGSLIRTAAGEIALPPAKVQ